MHPIKGAQKEKKTIKIQRKSRHDIEQEEIQPPKLKECDVVLMLSKKLEEFVAFTYRHFFVFLKRLDSRRLWLGQKKLFP